MVSSAHSMEVAKCLAHTDGVRELLAPCLKWCKEEKRYVLVWGLTDETPTALYVVRCDTTGAMKVGITNSPEKRLAGLRTGTPTQLRLVGCRWFRTREEARRAEKAAHILMKRHGTRIHGEWFSDSGGCWNIS